MRTIEHFYGADLDWIDHYAQQLGGQIEDNFIKIPEEVEGGTRYFLDCGEGIVTYFVNVQYNEDVRIIQKNPNTDFIGLYYNLTDGEAEIDINNFSYNVSRWQYNMCLFDSSLESDFHINAGTKIFALCIFIKKSLIKEFLGKHKIIFDNIDKIIDPKKNTVIRFGRMSNDSFHILDTLRKNEAGGAIFDLNLSGTVHMLLANFLRKIAEKPIIIQTIDKTDLTAIISIQMYLIENVSNHFPSIKTLAEKAYMSESKFKTLFNKITGDTPNVFFMENKLLLAKEMLETKQFSISQVSDQLNFTNNSYFASKFKEHFGISPKLFVHEL